MPHAFALRSASFFYKIKHENNYKKEFKIDWFFGDTFIGNFNESDNLCEAIQTHLGILR